MIRSKIRKSILLVAMAAMYLLSACGGSTQPASSSSEQAEPCAHELIKYGAKKATCLKDGCVAYWYCDDCGSYYLDHKATKEVTLEETVIAKLPHNLTKTEGVAPTCTKSGKAEYWTCSDCNRIFIDENAETRVEESQLSVSKAAHNLQHVEATPVSGRVNGVKEHWYCLECDNYFSDANGKKKVDKENTIVYNPLNIPDFLVEVPTGREPVVLQLTDTQIIDAGQVRKEDEGTISKTFYATANIQKYCYDYVTEIIEATNPDLILLTGDNIYGKFDDNGSVWTSFITFMDSFEIPWAPIFGNHDNESAKGVDWQCAQLEKAEYCLFEQKDLTGNGNYSVGIVQGEELKRVFYMLDTNGCASASEATLANGHTQREVGFGEDQIRWYTNQINNLKEFSPATKISMAYHIQQNAFAEAYAKYGFTSGQQYQDINIDTMENKAEGDFGIIGRDLKGEGSYLTVAELKELGVDSVFVGHEHCNSASVVYEGIRFQFGQKSSIYDRFNRVVTETGEVVGADGDIKAEQTALIGGSVIVLSEVDGTIKDAYIYYCEEAGGKIDWSQFVKTEDDQR